MFCISKTGLRGIVATTLRVNDDDRFLCQNDYVLGLTQDIVQTTLERSIGIDGFCVSRDSRDFRSRYFISDRSESLPEHAYCYVRTVGAYDFIGTTRHPLGDFFLQQRVELRVARSLLSLTCSDLIVHL